MKNRPASPAARRKLAAALLGIALAAAAASLLALAATPGRADEDDAENAVSAPSRVTVKNGVTILTLDAAARRNGGIATARLSPAPPEESTPAYGSVLDAAQLTELANRYLDAKARLETAEAKLAVSRAAFARAKTLYRDRHNISEAKLQAAQSRFEVDRAELDAARSHLETVSASAEQGWGAVLGRSVAEQGKLVERLVARRDFLVRVTLPPGVSLSPPPTASAEIDGRKIALGFVSPATTTDPRLQGTSYFYLASAESGLLPGLNLAVDLPARAASAGLVVPQGAVVWLDGKPWVYLRSGPDSFIRRGIDLRRAAPGGGYVATGLPAGAEIAVGGAQMLLSEEFRAQVAVGDQD